MSLETAPAHVGKARVGICGAWCEESRWGPVLAARAVGPQGCLRGRKDGARASGAQSDSEGLPAARNKAVFLILLKAHLLGV